LRQVTGLVGCQPVRWSLSGICNCRGSRSSWSSWLR
jgi:hypothetical protein